MCSKIGSIEVLIISFDLHILLGPIRRAERHNWECKNKFTSVEVGEGTYLSGLVQVHVKYCTVLNQFLDLTRLKAIVISA